VHAIKLLGNDVPSLLDLYRSVVPQYAVHWELLGVELGLEQHHLEIISRNNAYNPNRTEDCCSAMLQKWLKEIPFPTWGKLDDAINLIKPSLGGINFKYNTVWSHMHRYRRLCTTFLSSEKLLYQHKIHHRARSLATRTT